MGPRAHTVLLVLVALVLPLASRIFDTGNLAFTMFSRSETYRLRITTVSVTGQPTRLAPTEIAAAVGGNTGDILAGTEQWRHGPFGPLLRRHLGEVARFACGVRGANLRASVVLEQRPTLDSTIQTTEAGALCR
jgi:hypothetical protein